jgi:peptidyl-prolyl cis-trans isomerase A (cyclophilin A)
MHRIAQIFFLSLLALATLLISGPMTVAEEETEKAPEEFKVKFETSCGTFTLDVRRKDAPLGVDQFHKAVKEGFYDECRFFRVLHKPKPFVVQFGINGDPKVQKKWRDSPIKDDPVMASNVRGSVCYAKAGPDTRTTQLFISLGDNSRLDDMGFAPFAKVTEGIEVVDKISNTDQYDPNAPNQGKIQSRGNAYLKEDFPKLDYIKKATIVAAE